MTGGGFLAGGMAETKESMTAKVNAKAADVVAAKAAKKAPADIKALVAELLGLKVDYEVVAGEPFPKPANGRGGKKKKGGGKGGGLGAESDAGASGKLCCASWCLWRVAPISFRRPINSMGAVRR